MAGGFKVRKLIYMIRITMIFLLASTVGFSQSTGGYVLKMSDGTPMLSANSIKDSVIESVSNEKVIGLSALFAAKQATLVSGANIKTINGNPITGSGNLNISGSVAPVFLNLANSFSSTSTTLAPVTGWSFAVTSGVTYRVEVIADYQTAATTTGGTFGVSLTGATGTVRGVARGSINAAAAATEVSIPIRATSGAGSTVTTTAVSATNTPHFLYMLVTFTCTGSGTFNIVWASEVAASAAQINANSSLIYQPLN